VELPVFTGRIAFIFVKMENDLSSFHFRKRIENRSKTDRKRNEKEHQTIFVHKQTLPSSPREHSVSSPSTTISTSKHTSFLGYFKKQIGNRSETDQKQIRAIHQTIFTHQQTPSSPRQKYLFHPFEQPFPDQQVKNRSKTDQKQIGNRSKTDQNNSPDNIHPSTNILISPSAISSHPSPQLIPTPEQTSKSNQHFDITQSTTPPPNIPHPSQPPYNPTNHLKTHPLNPQQTLHKHPQPQHKQPNPTIPLTSPHHTNITPTSPSQPLSHPLPSFKNENSTKKKNKSQK
jgi:hypothetical protein